MWLSRGRDDMTARLLAAQVRAGVRSGQLRGHGGGDASAPAGRGVGDGGHAGLVATWASGRAEIGRSSALNAKLQLLFWADSHWELARDLGRDITFL